MLRLTLIAVIAALPIIVSAQSSTGGWDPDQVKKAQDTVDRFKEEQPKLVSYFDSAYAYAIYPSVGKVAWIIGGAHGSGMVFVGDQPDGRTKLTQGSVGFQFGGESFSEVVFFQNEKSFSRFTKGNFEFAAKASATLIKEGASTNLAYEDGVAVFTLAKGGLIVDASIGGQKFSYEVPVAADSASSGQ
jgi:lipid-binding SYLF domain-containing protein